MKMADAQGDAVAPPLGTPVLRTWEMDENTTRYEKRLAAPSDADLRIMWTLWAVLSVAVAIFVATVLTAVLRDRKARRNPFNLYLIYLMIPDVAFSALCALSCASNAIWGHYLPLPSLCQFQSIYLIFGVAANSWLNMLVARELFRLLQSSSQGQKYVPPTTRRVTVQALLVYLYAIFIATWTLYWPAVPWWPHRAVTIHGLGCFPLEYDAPSTIFYFAVFVPLLVGIPMLHVLVICYLIWRRTMLPPAGKRRLLALYFLRIVAAYIIMWVPYFVLTLASSGMPWVVFAGGSWGHLQGAVSAAISLTKPDIWRALRTVVPCLERCQCQTSTTTSSTTTPKAAKERADILRVRPTTEQSPPLSPLQQQITDEGISMKLLWPDDKSGDLVLMPVGTHLASVVRGECAEEGDDGASDQNHPKDGTIRMGNVPLECGP